MRTIALEATALAAQPDAWCLCRAMAGTGRALLLSVTKRCKPGDLRVPRRVGLFCPAAVPVLLILFRSCESSPCFGLLHWPSRGRYAGLHDTCSFRAENLRPNPAEAG